MESNVEEDDWIRRMRLAKNGEEIRKLIHELPPPENYEEPPTDPKKYMEWFIRTETEYFHSMMEKKAAQKSSPTEP